MLGRIDRRKKNLIGRMHSLREKGDLLDDLKGQTVEKQDKRKGGN